MTRVLTLIAALAATPALAQSEAETERLIAAIASAGCLVDEGNQAAILAAAGLTEDVAGRIVAALMSSGWAVPEGENLRLVTGPCGG